MFSIVVLAVNLKVFNDTSAHSIFSIVLCFGSIFIYVISIIFADRIESSDLFGTGGEMIRTREFYLVLLFATLGIVFIDVGVNYFSMENRE